MRIGKMRMAQPGAPTTPDRPVTAMPLCAYRPARPVRPSMTGLDRGAVSSPLHPVWQNSYMMSTRRLWACGTLSGMRKERVIYAD